MRKTLLFWGLLAGVLHAQTISVIDHGAYNVGTSTNPTLNTVGANRELACSTTGTTIQNGAGQTMVPVYSFIGFTGRVTVFQIINPTTSASDTFTSGGVHFTVVALNNVAAGPDKTAHQNTDGSPLPVTVIPSVANEFIYSCLEVSWITSPSTSNYTALSSSFDYGTGQTYENYYDAYTIQGGTPSSTTVNWLPNGGAGAVNGQTAGSVTFTSLATVATLAATTTSFPEAVAGTSYSTSLTASGGVQNYTWALTSGTLPTGLSVSSAGVISGTPASAGTTTGLVFRVTDAASSTANTISLTLYVASSALALAGSCPTGTQYVAYAGCTVASGGISPLTCSWSTAQGNISIPPGLTLNTSSCAVTGTNQGQGDFATTYTVTDGAGNSLTGAVTISVTQDNSWIAGLFPSNSIYHGGLDVSLLPVYSGPGAPTLLNHLREEFDGQAGLQAQKVPYNASAVSVQCPNGPSGCFQQLVTSGPFSANTPIEGTSNNSNASNYIGDGHALVYQPSSNGASQGTLYELFSSQWSSPNMLEISSTGFNTAGYTLPTSGVGTADAAGLCVTCYLANYDSMMNSGLGMQNNMLRFTLSNSQLLSAFFWPATAQSVPGGTCSSFQDANGLISQSTPPSSCSSGRTAYGTVYRLTSTFYNSLPAACTGSNTQAAAFMKTLRYRGMIASDGGQGTGIPGLASPLWNTTQIQACFDIVPGTAFEAVNLSGVIVSPTSTQFTQTLPTSATVSGRAVLGGSAKLQ